MRPVRHLGIVVGLSILVFLSDALLDASHAKQDPVDQEVSSKDTLDELRQATWQLLKQGQAIETYRQDKSGVDSALRIFDSVRVLVEIGFDDRDTIHAVLCTEISRTCFWKSEWQRADSLATRAVRIWEEEAGPNHPGIAEALFALAACYFRGYGRLAEVEPMYLRILALLEEAPPEYRHLRANAFNNLAMARMELGRTDGADTLYLRAMNIWKDAPEESYKHAFAKINLGYHYYFYQNREEEAEQMYLEGQAELEAYHGMDHFDLHFALKYLADLYRRRGDYDDAAKAIRRSSEFIRKTRGPDDLYLSYVLRQYGNIEIARGNAQAGLAILRDATRIASLHLGPNHKDLANTYIWLAQACGAAGEFEAGYDAYMKGLRARQMATEITFPFASEEKKLQFVAMYPLVVRSFPSFVLAHESAEARRSGLEMVVRGKARVLDAMAAEREYAFCSEDPELRHLIDTHTDVCGDIANLTLSAMIADHHADSLAGLYRQKDSLETALSMGCEDYRLKLAGDRFTADYVAPALPPNGVLWEIHKFKPFRFDLMATMDEWQPARYMAWTLDRSGSVTATDLGPAAHIDSLVDAYRSAMQEAAARLATAGSDERLEEARLADITRQLYGLLVAPIEEVQGDVNRLFISPDAKLSLLPFELLQDDDGEYLIEKYQISYVSSGRDLVKFQGSEDPPLRFAVVIADPDYNSEPEVAEPPMLALAAHSTFRGPSDRDQCLNTLFGALPSTRSEGEAIKQALSADRVDTYYGPQASEATLKSLSEPPDVLHLASHGYYCDGARFSAGSELKENPLLYSGIALAGANRPILGTPSADSSGDDGILTALEASALDLTSTELVVLSACQSGVGDVVNGEGVYGLRRAFQLAGANSVIMSMFAVPDQATVTLMERFYNYWQSGQSKAAALRNAALSLLKERRDANGAAHPLFWGGFILVGDPG